MNKKRTPRVSDQPIVSENRISPKANHNNCVITILKIAATRFIKENSTTVKGKSVGRI